MRIEAHLLHWQEKDIMPLVVKHYRSFCDEIIIHDNHSKDGSAELAKELGCTVIPFGSNFFDDEINRDLKNNVWKGSKADFVVVADFDEILLFTIPHGLPVGDRIAEDCTIFKTIGWQIMSEEMPKNDLLEITNGYEFKNYAKNIIFSPTHITDISYGLGAHDANPKGVVRWSETPLYVLHYKHIGGVQRTIDRYKEYKPRMSKFNRRFGHGCHYLQSTAQLKQEWKQRMEISRPLI